MKTFVFDLDDTLTVDRLDSWVRDNRKSLEEDQKYYALLQVNHDILLKIIALKEEGHRIIIHTARGMKTCGGNIDLIKERLGSVTIDWLRKNNVPYDELIFGKPWGDFYIDDKNLSIKDFMDANY